MTTSNTAEQKSVIGKKELRSIFLRSLSLEYSWNYERQQNMGYCFAMLPAIKKIYQKKEDQIAAAKRHMEFFNTTPYISTAVFGISTAMEESNARNEDFDTSSINNVKVALMGPLAGIGDSMFWGTLRVIATGIANEITIDAIRKGGEEKQRILNEMMFADLGICNVELSGTRENPIISTVHQRIDDSGKQNQYTHDTGLLDLKLLRRDQIWFAEKDEKSMQTDIYALTEFSPRKEENIARGYLQGRYGAIPFIGGGI